MVKLTDENVKTMKDYLHFSPIYKFLGMEVMDIKEGYSKVRIPFKKDLLQAEGVVHGGVLATICDSAAGIALFSLVDSEDIIATIELNVNYLEPVKSGEIIAEGKITHKGHRTALGDVEVRNEGRLVCKTLATFIIIKKEDKEYNKLPYRVGFNYALFTF